MVIISVALLHLSTPYSSCMLCSCAIFVLITFIIFSFFERLRNSIRKNADKKQKGNLARVARQLIKSQIKHCNNEFSLLYVLVEVRCALLEDLFLLFIIEFLMKYRGKNEREFFFFGIFW